MALAKQVFESPDLIRLIYSFGDPSHRIFTAQLKVHLRPRPDLFAQGYQERSQQELYEYTLYDHLFTYTDQEIQQYIKEYTRCFCCSRHSHLKPRWIYRASPPKYVFENIETKCDCCCRSLTRAFIRHLEYGGYEEN